MLSIQNSADAAGPNFKNIYKTLFTDEHLTQVEDKLSARRADYEAAYGLTPSDEFIYLSLLLEDRRESDWKVEWESHFEEWYIADPMCDPGLLKDESELKQHFSNRYFLLTLFTGLELFGSDSGMDEYLVSQRGHADSSPVFPYDDEDGKIEPMEAGSITSFFVNRFGLGAVYDFDEYDEEEHGEENEYGLDGSAVYKIRGILSGFNGRTANAWKDFPAHRKPLNLFRRSHWLLGLATGEPGEELKIEMSRAAEYETWLEELSLLDSEPQLANYWLLHHFFLGNAAALEKTMAAAAGSAASVTRFINRSVGEASGGAQGLFELSREQTEELIAQARRNAMPRLLEPALK